MERSLPIYIGAVDIHFVLFEQGNDVVDVCMRYSMEKDVIADLLDFSYHLFIILRKALYKRIQFFKMQINSIKVIKSQEKNPLLSFKKFHFTVGEIDMVEDYQVSEHVSVLFLSLEYHRAYPLYIVQRLD